MKEEKKEKHQKSQNHQETTRKPSYDGFLTVSDGFLTLSAFARNYKKKRCERQFGIKQNMFDEKDIESEIEREKEKERARER